jgi:hypothetical protein
MQKRNMKKRCSLFIVLLCACLPRVDCFSVVKPQVSLTKVVSASNLSKASKMRTISDSSQEEMAYATERMKADFKSIDWSLDVILQNSGAMNKTLGHSTIALCLALVLWLLSLCPDSGVPTH